MRRVSANGAKFYITGGPDGKDAVAYATVIGGEMDGQEFVIWHSDLTVVIDDPDAEFVFPEDGEPYLDHSAETLGLD